MIKKIKLWWFRIWCLHDWERALANKSAVNEQTLEDSILMAGIENAVMGAFSDGYDARGEGMANQSDAVARCTAIQTRVLEIIHTELQKLEKAMVALENIVTYAEKFPILEQSVMRIAKQALEEIRGKG